jgi:hypothetical protein
VETVHKHTTYADAHSNNKSKVTAIPPDQNSFLILAYSKLFTELRYTFYDGVNAMKENYFCEDDISLAG